jgi:hypothetical protein
MIELTVLFFIGFVIVFAGVYTLVRSLRESAQNEECSSELLQLVELPGLGFRSFSLLFADSDYRMLLAEPRLLHLARQLRRDRRRIALKWLGSLRRDVLSLWRLRRLLTKYDVTRGVSEELTTVVQATTIVALISSLSLCVFLLGPFVFAHVVSRGRQQAEVLSRSCGAALHRLPKSRWAEFAEEWHMNRATVG